MGGPLPQLLDLLGVENVLVFVMALTRIAPLFIIAPVFSSKQIPTQAKVVIAIALAIGLTPAADPGKPLEGGTFDLLSMLAIEFLVGAALAYALACLISALEVAGTILDFTVGFSFGAQVDPISGNQNSVLARMYGLIGVIIFLTIGGDEWVIRGIARTYELVPIGSTPDIERLIGGMVDVFGAIFGAALQISAPILLALVLTDVGFGLVTRVVPQLNVFAVGLPVKVLVGMILIGVTLPLVGGWVTRELEQSVGAALRSLRVA